MKFSLYSRILARFHVPQSFMIISCSLFVILFLLPLLNYFRNSTEINLYGHEVMLSGIVVVLLLSLIFAFAVSNISKNRVRYVEVVLVWLAIAAWLQANFIAWKGPILDGQLISKHWFYDQIATELILWIGTLFIISYLGFKVLGRSLLLLISIFSIFGTIVVIAEMESVVAKPVDAATVNGFDESALLRLSSSENVFLFIFDEMQNNFVEQVFLQDNDLMEQYKDFVFFKDVLGGYQSTIPSIPLMFSGMFYKNEQPYSEYAHSAYMRPSSMFPVFKSKGYEVNIVPYAANTFYPQLNQHDNHQKFTSTLADRSIELLRLYDLSIYTMVPGPVKQHVYSGGEWLFSSIVEKLQFDYEDLLMLNPDLPQGPGDSDTRLILNMINEASVTSEHKKLFAVHLDGAHVPFNLDEDGNHVEASKESSSYTKKIIYKLKLFVGFLDLLKKLGIYDTSAIIIVSDHGSGRSESTRVFSGQGDTDLAVKARATPVLLVKGLNRIQKRLEFSELPVSIENLNRDFAVLVEDSETSDSNQQLARRYVHYQWTPQLDDYLPKYREYIVAGNVRDNDSWMPLHVHDPGFPQKFECLFAIEGRNYIYDQTGASIVSSDSIHLENPDNASILLLKVSFSDETDFTDHSHSIDVLSDGKKVFSKTLRTVGSEYTEGVQIPVANISNTTIRIRSSEKITIENFLLLTEAEDSVRNSSTIH